MNNDRSAVINIGGDEYELLLTTLATKEITKKYNGLENLGEALESNDNLTEMLEMVLWLIVLLANQSILIHNHKNKGDTKELLTVETLELLTTPADLVEFKDAIMTAITKGTTRHVQSEDDGKNTETG
jgi:hypothetical protein